MINTHNTNIVIINSGDNNYQLARVNPGNIGVHKNQNAPKNSTTGLKTIVDYPSFEESEDREHKESKGVASQKQMSGFNLESSYRHPSEGKPMTENILGKTSLLIFAFSIY